MVIMNERHRNNIMKSYKLFLLESNKSRYKIDLDFINTNWLQNIYSNIQ